MANDVPDPTIDRQLEGATKAIMREYGNVIGENQARNIAWHALVGALGAASETVRDLYLHPFANPIL